MNGLHYSEQDSKIWWMHKWEYNIGLYADHLVLHINFISTYMGRICEWILNNFDVSARGMVGWWCEGGFKICEKINLVVVVFWRKKKKDSFDCQLKYSMSAMFLNMGAFPLSDWTLAFLIRHMFKGEREGEESGIEFWVRVGFGVSVKILITRIVWHPHISCPPPNVCP